MAAIGRPKIELTEAQWKQLSTLCGIQCTTEEISAVLDISIDTLERRIREKHGISFGNYINQHAAGGRASLRRYQFALAQKNAGMAIWLGKQYLGQREPAEDDGMEIEDADAIYEAAIGGGADAKADK